MSDQAKQATQRAADAIVQKQTVTPRPLLRPPLPALPALPTPAPAILVLINETRHGLFLFIIYDYLCPF
ncbi:uncharacterized protein OCT59_010200 [Rhizophagus irregularis]|uniref:uncharacterized protein n=1 Tax=Rhizophagus irregularis TaxID=588596 RepID=UPI003317FDBC|nr:hypothetical protein OCT59_010200 [Rhizophagus irregularis]